MSLDSSTHAKINTFYKQKLQAGGTTPAGVDFNSTFAQRERFFQLLRITDADKPYSILDYGCGYGELLRYLNSTGMPYAKFTGYDVTEAMVDAARQTFGGDERVTFTSKREELEEADYIVGSGLFNISFMDGIPAWMQHIERTIDDMATLAVRGFAFNMLTSYSDAEKMRPDLYYGDPHYYFDYCRKFSRNIAILHDYDLYDFTILVRKALPDKYRLR